MNTRLTRAKNQYGLVLAGLVLTAVLLSVAPQAPAASKPPLLTRAHSHNDYAHKHPLKDALDHGLCSVEADINLVDGQLLVAHSLKQTDPKRTLQRLYLDPLRKRIRANEGHVHPGSDRFWLLIEMKTDDASTYPVLHKVLEQYADILTVHKGADTTWGPVTVVIDGGRNLIEQQHVRYTSIDGNLPDLDSDAPATLVPWISDAWRSAFTWLGEGPMPENERAKLREIVQKAHAKGRVVRFYALPAQPTIWPELYDAGVDLLNADDHNAIQKFLLSREKR